MTSLGEWIQFGERRLYRDEVESDLDFTAYAEAKPAWRYPDLTEQVAYLADVIRETIQQESRLKPFSNAPGIEHETPSRIIWKDRMTLLTASSER